MGQQLLAPAPIPLAAAAATATGGGSFSTAESSVGGGPEAAVQHPSTTDNLVAVPGDNSGVVGTAEEMAGAGEALQQSQLLPVDVAPSLEEDEQGGGGAEGADDAGTEEEEGRPEEEARGVTL
jgi:hypothetical protein